MKILSRLLPLALFAPLFALAAPGELVGVSNFLKNITAFMNNTLVPLIFAIAFLVFLWGMFKTFILGGHDEEKQSEGKALMMYAIAGFVLMVSLWGIVNLVANGFGLREQGLNQLPNLPINNN
jgi:fumarate reductase subunit D